MWMPARLRHAALIGLLAAELVAALITACGSSKLRASTAVTPVTPLKGRFARIRCWGSSIDERCLPGAQGLEPAHLAAFAQQPPGALRLGKAGKLLRPKLFQIKQMANLPAGRFRDYQRGRPGQGLQPSGKVRRLSDDPALLRCALAPQIADHGQPRGDAKPYT